MEINVVKGLPFCRVETYEVKGPGEDVITTSDGQIAPAWTFYVRIRVMAGTRGTPAKRPYTAPSKTSPSDLKSRQKGVLQKKQGRRIRRYVGSSLLNLERELSAARRKGSRAKAKGWAKGRTGPSRFWRPRQNRC